MSKNPSPSPYKLHINEGAYSFVSDQQLTYICHFLDVTHMLSPVVGIYDIEVLDFEFDVFPRTKAKHDPRVAATIKTLMLDAFADNKRAILYLCDNSDNKAKSRYKVFNQWADDPAFNRDNLEVVSGDKVLLGSLITRKDFPYRSVLENDVIEPIKGFAITKFGG